MINISKKGKNITLFYGSHSALTFQDQMSLCIFLILTFMFFFIFSQEAVKGLITGGLDIVSLTDVTPIPHNGPKPKKQRRL